MKTRFQGLLKVFADDTGALQQPDEKKRRI
jgi:hypothetical protein